MSATSIQLTVNGVLHTVGAEEAFNTPLSEYLRTTLGLTGTHVTCRQGGCGACTVVATVPNTGTAGTSTFSVNSCLAWLCNCDGWSITTIEGMGNGDDGYHPIQETLARYNGTQCGFCSPGFVMNMMGLTQQKRVWGPADVEGNLDGHICRCTGYRPILEAFKSLTPLDIEDMAALPCVKKGSPSCRKSLTAGGATAACDGSCSKLTSLKKVTADGATFYEPTSVQELLGVLASLPAESDCQLMFGNTLFGVTGVVATEAIISMRHISDLGRVTVSGSEVTAEAAVSIVALTEAFKQAASQAGFAHLAEIEAHWNKVGSVSVRNLAGWAGNLAYKCRKPNFASDLYVTLVAAGADVLIGQTDGSVLWTPVEDLVGRDLMAKREVILKLRLLPLPAHATYRSYKIMPRSKNTKAIVNAAFKLPVNLAGVVEDPVLAFGGISSTFVRASATEAYLVGKSLADESVLQEALTTLGTELIPDAAPDLLSPQYRKELALGLFYKAVLSILSDSGVVSPGILTDAGILTRPAVTAASQTFDQNTDSWPLGEPIPKIEAKAQCAGEAKYIDDEPPLPNELFGFFVQSERANAAIAAVDPSAALAMPGVVGFVSAEDVPGVNNIQTFGDTDLQPVFASGRCAYYGQAIGLLLGSNSDAVKAAVSQVAVTYSDEKTPVVTIAGSLASGTPPIPKDPVVKGDVAAGFAASSVIVEGAMNRDGQYHFHMESQVARVVPTEDTYSVFAPSQWPTSTQAAIAQVLGLDTNRIDVSVKRLGGAFGAKISAGNLVTTAAAVAAHKFRRPVRVALDLKTNMTMIGWRDPFLCTYKVGVDSAGGLQAVEATVYGDAGYIPVDSCAPDAAQCFHNCYSCPNLKITPNIVLTDTASNTWCRSPGTIEGITFMEYVMEHAARAIKMDPLEFRKLNLIPDGGSLMANTLSLRARLMLRAEDNNKCYNLGLRCVKINKNLIFDMIAQIEREADVAARKADIEQYNKDNRWRKRGLAVMPMLYPYEIPSVYGFGVLVSIFGNDGTVAISHGGIEIGQGINTKVVQVAAYTLGCEVSQIRIKATDTTISANSFITGGSHGSDINCYCVRAACLALKARLDAIAQEGDTWQATVRRAYDEGVTLSEHYWNGPDEVRGYSVFGVACTEVELDVLTGQFLVLRTDIIEDAGKSTSPMIDIGQVEGSWVYGQGLCTTEGPKYDHTTGAKISLDTWLYHPLLSLDIPTDLRVTLLSNAPNPDGVLSSKVTNEPPTSLAFSVPLALRVAVTSARADAGDTTWFQMDTPLTTERLQQMCLVDPTSFGYTWPTKRSD